MFKNSGKKIMGLVKFVFYANLILVALAVVVGVAAGAMGAIPMEWYWVLLIGVSAGLLYLFVLYLLLLGSYAFGELVQSTVDQKTALEALVLRGDRNPPVVHREPVCAESAQKAREADMDPPYGKTYVKPSVELNAAYMGGGVLVSTPVAGASEPEKQAPAAPEPPAVPTPPADGPRVCPRCGAKHSPDVKFCRYCGSQLS